MRAARHFYQFLIPITTLTNPYTSAHLSLSIAYVVLRQKSGMEEVSLEMTF